MAAAGSAVAAVAAPGLHIDWSPAADQVFTVLTGLFYSAVGVGAALLSRNVAGALVGFLVFQQVFGGGFFAGFAPATLVDWVDPVTGLHRAFADVTALHLLQFSAAVALWAGVPIAVGLVRTLCAEIK